MRIRPVIVCSFVCFWVSLVCPALSLAALGDVLWEIPNPNPQPLSSFGYSMATFDNRIVVGAPGQAGFQDVGDVYVFDATTRNQLFAWHGPSSKDFIYFGFSVAAAGNTIAVGAPYGYDGTGTIRAGAVYLYDGTTGGFLREIPNPQPNPLDGFGSHVAPYGNDKFLIAAGWDDTRGKFQEGAVYLYSNLGQQLQKFVPPTPTESIDFGKWATAVGDNVLIGAQGDSGGGAAYLFDAAGNLLHRYPNPGGGWYFGHSVGALDGNVLVTDYNHATTLFQGTDPWLPIHTFPEGGDVRVIGDDVLIRPDAGTTLTLFDGDPPYEPYKGFDPKMGIFSCGPGMAPFGKDILVSSDFDGTGAGRVYLLEVPEPSTFLMCFLLGGLAITIGWWRRRRTG